MMIPWLEDNDLADDLLLDSTEKIVDSRIKKYPSLARLHRDLKMGDVEIAGLILDLAIDKAHDLRDVGLDNVKTGQGLEAGYWFLVHCIRNYDDSYSVYDHRFRKAPVLILTSARLPKVKMKFRRWIEHEDEQNLIDSSNWGKTTWRSKPDFDQLGNFRRFIKEWLKSC